MSGLSPVPSPKIFSEDTLITLELVTAVISSVAPFAYVIVSTPEFASGKDSSLSKVTTLPSCEIVPAANECKFILSREFGGPVTSNAFPKIGV